MTKARCLTLDVGQHAAQPVLDGEIAHYEEILSVLSPSRLHLDPPPTQSIPVPLVAASDVLDNARRQLAGPFSDALEKTECLLIEIRRPARQEHSFLPQIYDAIRQVLDEVLVDALDRSPQPTVVILMDSIPPAFATGGGSFILISRSEGGLGGPSAVQSPGLDESQVSQISQILGDWREDIRDRVSERLVRHKGVFQLPGAEVPVDTLVDGRLCIPELRELLNQHVSQFIENGSAKKVLILGVGGVLSWFSQVVAGSQKDLKVTAKVVGEDDDAAIRRAVEASPYHILILAPVYVTGSTIRDAVNEMPRDVTVSAATFFRMKRTGRSLGAARLDVRGRPPIDVAVLAGEQHHRKVAELSDFAVPVDPLNPLVAESGPALTSVEFWTAVRDHGPAAKELAVPREREALFAVPDFDSLLAEESAWLGDRLRSLISLHTGEELFDLLVIMPAEPVDSASSKLAAFLSSEIVAASVLRVDRKLVDAVSALDKSVDLAAELPEEAAALFAKLDETISESVARSTVLIDEFRASGTTGASLARIVRACEGPDVVGMFCILDLGAPRPVDLDVYSLYSWKDPEVLTGRRVAL